MKIHQMLHGYRLGHNYIQGSIVLPSTHDMDKIATLSDWSEYVGIDNMRDYITAYPLDESPYYVVAKTWYADGMQRPGCVWTHSLLIQKEDLAEITDFCNLLPLFEFPETENNSYENYSQPLAFVINDKESEHQLAQLGENRISELYELILSEKPSFILTEFSSQQSQELLLCLLDYLPVKILKRKSFCSGTAAPRSYEGEYLSLQLVSHDGSTIKSLSGRPTVAWAQLVGVSIANNRLQVARLIKHYQDEIGESVAKLIGFLSVIVLINRVCKDNDEKQEVLLEIIKMLSHTFPSKEEGSIFKAAVFQPSLARDLGGEENFLYTISTIDLSPFTDNQIEYRKRLHELSSDQFLTLLKHLYSTEKLNEWGMQTIHEVSQYISYSEIAELRKVDKIFFQTIISSSPEILNQIVWSDFTKEDLQSTLTIFSNKEIIEDFQHWRELFKTMLDVNLTIAAELTRMMFSHDKNCVLEYLTYIGTEGNQPQISVSKEIEQYPEIALEWLSSVSYINHNVAYVLVNAIDEVSTLVKSKGSKIWMPLNNLLTENDSIQYFIFLYRLSFNWQDKEALEYMKHAFYPIHRLLAQDKLEYSFWYRIEPYTEHLFLIWNWDKCKKMRKMVIRRLKEAGCSKSVVVNYTPDAQTNDWLLKEW